MAGHENSSNSTGHPGSSRAFESGTKWIATDPEDERRWVIQLVFYVVLVVPMYAAVGYILFLVRPIPVATALELFAIAAVVGFPLVSVYYYRLNFVTRVGITAAGAIFQFRSRQIWVGWDDVRPLPMKARRAFSRYWFRRNLQRDSRPAPSVAIAVTEEQARALLERTSPQPF